MQENRCSRSEGLLLLSSSILSTSRVPLTGSPNKENLGYRENVSFTSLPKVLVDPDEPLMKPRQALRSGYIATAWS